jgi:hypothetical protein
MDAMVNLVGELAASHYRRESEGKRCHTYFEMCHSSDHILDLYEQAIRELARDANGVRDDNQKINALGESGP